MYEKLKYRVIDLRKIQQNYKDLDLIIYLMNIVGGLLRGCDYKLF